MIYLFFILILSMPIMKAMEPAESNLPEEESEQPKRTSSSLKLKFDVSDPNDNSKNEGILKLYHFRPGSLKDTEMKVESYEKLKGVSPIRTTEADIFKIHSALGNLEPDQKKIVLDLLKELKGDEKVPTFKERLKVYPWIIEDSRIYRFIQAAYEARGYPRTNEVLDSCMTTLSSFHTSASPTPTFMSTAPASHYTYSSEITAANIQQMQNQQIQMQQNQQMQTQMMQQLSNQLWTLALKQTIEKQSESDFHLKDFIDPKKIIKNSIIITVIALFSVGNSAVSYFLGGQSSCE